jgi:NADPH:quinone reductase-like Zn-dependent oxidoreductase
MRAVSLPEYGPPEVLRLVDAPKPEPGPRDLLVRVVATSVNPVDTKIRSGGQRNIIRYRLPWILGLDVSGVVEAVGKDVRGFAVGDAVWSSPTHRRPGTYAEYVVIAAREAAHKPRTLTHLEAASLPLVALTAYQCLFEHGRLARGQTVLVHAGAGGVGTVAIQLARHAGARVVTTASARNAELVRSLGADVVVDYATTRVADVVRDVDLILDSLGEPAYAENLAAIRRGGRISNITLDVTDHVERYGPNLSLLTLGWSFARFHARPWLDKRVAFRHVIKRCDGAQLRTIADLVDQGALRPVVDRVLPLEAVVEAHHLSESRRVRGKLVLQVADEPR